MRRKEHFLTAVDKAKIAKLLAQGIQRSFIAQRFGISLKTVDEIRKSTSQNA